jgi:hypothetical protein
MTLFDCLKAITDPKKDLDFLDPEVLKAYDTFMINRFISMVDVFLLICAQINFYEIPKEQHYNYYKSILPQQNIFFKYIKKEKDFNFEEKKILAKHFGINLRKIDEYISMMDEKECKEILNIYKDQDGSYSYAE